MSERMNVFEMYVSNGNKAGFYVKRTKSKHSRIDSIAGKSEGVLDGKPPYYGNPKVKVTEFSTNKCYSIEPDEFLRCAGNYTYSLCDEDGCLL